MSKSCPLSRRCALFPSPARAQACISQAALRFLGLPAVAPWPGGAAVGAATVAAAADASSAAAAAAAAVSPLSLACCVHVGGRCQIGLPRSSRPVLRSKYLCTQGSRRNHKGEAPQHRVAASVTKGCSLVT